MDFAKLNPYIRSCAMYETVNKDGECIAYEARLFYMVSGEISLSIDGKKIKFEGGNLVYIPAGIKYRLKGQYLLMAALSFDFTSDFSECETKSPDTPESFNPSLIKETADAPFDKVLFLKDADAERENFTEICELAISKEGEWKAEISAMLKLILIRLAAMTDERALPPRMVKNLDAYIRENRKDEISNTEIGAIFGYHPFYVSNKLKEAKGITLRQYIISYRIKLAKNLLECTAKSMAEIAEEAGFTDASYFTKSFKTAVGITPKEYRAKSKENFI